MQILKQRERVVFLIGFSILVLCFTDIALAKTVQLKSLRFWTAPDHTRFVFDVSAPVGRKVFTLDGPRRVVIDLKDTHLSGKILQPPKSHPLFKKIRSAPRDKTNLRVVIDLKEGVRPKDFLLTPNNTYGHRLVLDLYTNKSVPQTPSPSIGAKKAVPELKKPSLPPAIDKAPKPVRLVKKQSTKPDPKVIRSKNSVIESNPGKITDTRKTTQSGFKSDRSSYVLDEKKRKTPKPIRITKRAKPKNEVIIAIDAGHGGDDVGATGAKGTLEKDVVLSVAKKLERLIKKQPGMRPVMIRDGDYYVGLRQRMKKARKAKADLFVSIHADAFRMSSIKGSSVYTLSSKGASSEAAKWLATQENKSDLVGGVSLDGKGNDLVELLLDLSQTATHEVSSEVADKVLKNLKNMGPVHKRTVQRAGFVVLKSPDIPSILVETAFISNPSEEKKLKSSKHQMHIAKAIFQGIRDHFAMYTRPGVHVASGRKEKVGRVAGIPVGG